MANFQFWAQRGKVKIGPYPTRLEALGAFRACYPFKGKDYEAKASRNQITTGFGDRGPWFSIQWHDAKEIETDETA